MCKSNKVEFQCHACNDSHDEVCGMQSALCLPRKL